MKKILLIGKLNPTLKELYESICGRYYVQVSAEPWKIVEGMMTLFEPDMVVINVLDLEDIEENVFRVLEYSYKDLPVVVIASEEGCVKYKKYLTRDKMMSLKRPISKQDIIQVCDMLLKADGETETMEMWEPAEETMPLAPSAPKRLLVVDDSPVTLRSIKAMLEKNYQISVATSGEQALKSIQKNKPDVILLDYEMPGMDGRETFEKIRENKETCDIPVIFLTGVADKEHIAAVLRLKPAGYLLKPADKEKLIGTIEGVV